MKKLVVLFSAGALVMASCVSNPEGKKAEIAEENTEVQQVVGTPLAVNTELSQVIWNGRKVSGQHHGTIQISSGTLQVEGTNVVGGEFVIDMNTINNQDMEGEYKTKLEGHLKSADFFDVANYPQAKFVVTSVSEGTAPGQVSVSGNLTIKDITKNITFDATVVNVSETGAQVTADFNIAREDWGVNYAGQADDLISKEINFKINLVAGN
jgi:polyisoprenoid-binding protein YceI